MIEFIISGIRLFMVFLRLVGCRTNHSECILAQDNSANCGHFVLEIACGSILLIPRYQISHSLACFLASTVGYVQGFRVSGSLNFYDDRVVGNLSF